MNECCCECPENHKPIVTCRVENNYFYWTVEDALVAMLIHENRVTHVITETEIVLIDGAASGGPIPIITAVDLYTIMGSNKCGTNYCYSYCPPPTCCEQVTYECDYYDIVICNNEYIDNIKFVDHPNKILDDPLTLRFSYPAPIQHVTYNDDSICQQICTIVNPCFSTKNDIIFEVSNISDINFIQDNTTFDGFGNPTRTLKTWKFTGLNNLNGTYVLPRTFCNVQTHYICDVEVEISTIIQVNNITSGYTYYEQDIYTYTLQMFITGLFTSFAGVYFGNIVDAFITHDGDPREIVHRERITILQNEGQDPQITTLSQDYYLCLGWPTYNLKASCEEPFVINGEILIDDFRTTTNPALGHSLDCPANTGGYYMPFGTIPFRSEGYFV